MGIQVLRPDNLGDLNSLNVELNMHQTLKVNKMLIFLGEKNKP